MAVHGCHKCVYEYAYKSYASLEHLNQVTVIFEDEKLLKILSSPTPIKWHVKFELKIWKQCGGREKSKSKMSGKFYCLIIKPATFPLLLML